MIDYPEAYIHYLRQFHQTRDFFECHEILEEYWKEHPESPLRNVWHGLIQVAVAMYHERRGNRMGAVKMLSSAVTRLREQELDTLGIAKKPFLIQLQQRLIELHEADPKPYRDLNIPITDPKLLQYVESTLDSAHLSEDVIHKHTRRDRSDVIAARNNELIKRRTSN